ncbi:his Kinase A domain protein [Bordetella holmesii 70147]|nr:his Kinase A domain protein [Bordetella holmesii 70147]
MIWLRTLLLIVLWAVISLLLHALAGSPAGWVLFSAAMTAMVLWRSWRLQRVSAWAHDPDTAPPAGVGPWEDILAPLYRYTRARRRELAELQDTMQGMLAAAQALPDGVVTLNEDYQIEWGNRMARRHLGLRLPADRGQNLMNLLRSPEFVAYAHRSNWPEPILVRVGQSGQERVMMIQLATYASSRRLLITRDVTQIEKLETTRRDFVANVSHELRTPLTVLAGFLETLHDMPPEALGEEQRSQYLAMMLEQAQRMQAIVEDLLTLSTLESSPGTDPVAVNIQALLQTARQQAEALSGGRHHFEWQVDANLDVLGSGSELASALSNLLTNAVRYTPRADISP